MGMAHPRGRGEAPAEEPIPVVLAGARGHGRWHLDNIRRLAAEGTVRLAGVCELRPLTRKELGDGLGAPEQSGDLAGLVARTGARIAVICTPIHTHADLALAAAERGAHLLLEKPPTPSYAEFARMSEGLRGYGTACQIGFQSHGSHALPAIRNLVADGRIGAIRGIGAAGAWVRDEDYYARAPWAGHRALDGRDVVDGVLTNPLAHAVATALHLAGADRAEDVAGIELELYRANAIESDDTSCVRIRTSRGTTVAAAVTLCAEEPGEPYVVVHGDRGRITFWYKLDRVRVERDGAPPETTDHARTDLLDNLVSHLRDGTELLAPPDRTGAFMRVVEAVRTAPAPVPLPADAWRTEPGAGVTSRAANRRVVTGIDRLVTAGAERLALYSELRAPWAARPAEVPHP
ncbi:MULTISPECIES: Gfo/Idh/MocA family protein [Streptomyces]|uniref:Gfo/Idh/MocA family protein n=1 Tax=Streptomyces TaxID=1883 RepID=UPI000A3CCDFB|nr:MULTISPECIES: Gfo/Idh/MocA family oxidoreductase [Streptomyces]RSS30467.1 gfo/Idh/MocA family oxidoreductase [Streptomyces sp. WAC05858]WTB08633.1 Gfo/Idh/MocA family oxidoreductase [Streptomyces antimycoticus]